MHRRLSSSLGLIAVIALAFAGAARADVTIGSNIIQAGATASPCGTGRVLVQPFSDPSTPYTVPVAGTLTGWRINTTFASPGDSITLVVLRPLGPLDYSVAGTDTKTLPSPLPAGGTAWFAASIPVAARDILGLYTNSSAPPICFSQGGDTPADDGLYALSAPSAPVAGQTLSVSGSSPAASTLNVAATIVPDQYVRVSTSAGPANATVGNLALLSSSVVNGGPFTGPITFTDDVPAGLTIASAVAGSGTCSTSGQRVICTIEDLAPFGSAPVNILVTPTAAKTYANAVSVAPKSGRDSNLADNAASATLTVGAAPPVPKCTVPSLKRTPSSVAKRVLAALGCKVGKSKRAHTSAVAKGLVIKTTPKAGTYAAGRTVRITVSSGRRKKHHR